MAVPPLALGRGVGEGLPAPVNYQLINSGSFLLVLVSACKRLLVCGIGRRHSGYGIRKKKKKKEYFFLSQGWNIHHPALCTYAFNGANTLLDIWFPAGFGVQYIVFANSFFFFWTVQKCGLSSFTSCIFSNKDNPLCEHDGGPTTLTVRCSLSCHW